VSGRACRSATTGDTRFRPRWSGRGGPAQQEFRFWTGAGDAAVRV